MDHEALALDIIETLMATELKIKALPAQGFDARGIAIALMHLETAQLWITNARPDVP